MTTMPDARRLTRQQAPELVRKHPVAKAVKQFVARVRDLEDSAQRFVAVAEQLKQEDADKILKDLSETAGGVNQPGEPHGASIRAFLHLTRRLDRLAREDRAGTLKTSLFLGLFSAFDTFTGDLLSALFSLRPELFNRLGGDVPLGDILTAESIEDLRKRILGDRIEDFRRKSYVEQFETLEKLFDIKLKGFEAWPRFVEASQRRNLFAHCDGVVTDQYVAICKREGYDCSVCTGEKLVITTEYLSQACLLSAEVGFKLAQTLWRKVAPNELELAEKHLHETAYEALQFEEWMWAQAVSDFGVSQRKRFSEENRLIELVNYAIALKFANRAEDMRKLLEPQDWSAVAAEFKLAHAVLFDRFDDAAALMNRLGKSTDLIGDFAYHDWPLFRDFRGTPQFLTAYEAVYGRPFTVNVAKAIAEAAEVSQSASLHELAPAADQTDAVVAEHEEHPPEQEKQPAG